MVFRVAVDVASGLVQVGHYHAVVHALRHLDGDGEQLELALVRVGIAEPVSHDGLIARVDALEPVEVPAKAENVLSVLENLFGVLVGGVDDDGVELHGYIPFHYSLVDLAGACAPAVVGLPELDGDVGLDDDIHRLEQVIGSAVVQAANIGDIGVVTQKLFQPAVNLKLPALALVAVQCGHALAGVQAGQPRDVDPVQRSAQRVEHGHDLEPRDLDHVVHDAEHSGLMRFQQIQRAVGRIRLVERHIDSAVTAVVAAVATRDERKAQNADSVALHRQVSVFASSRDRLLALFDTLVEHDAIGIFQLQQVSQLVFVHGSNSFLIWAY